MEVDVAVVGGGPAGASAAYFLATRGRSVLVVEQKTFPRDKTCGDGLTPRAIRVLDDMGLQPRQQGWQEVRGVRVHAGGKHRSVPVPSTRRWCDYGLVTPRRVLDQLVLDNAEAAGAAVWYATKALRPLVERGVVRGLVTKPGAREVTVRATWVVCAEGAAGTLLRGLGRGHDPLHPVGLALREYRARGPERCEWFDVHVDLREPWGLLPGYGWAFPAVGGAVNVGVGLLHRARHGNNIRLHAHLDHFVQRLVEHGLVDGSSPGRDRRGGRLFMGSSVWPAHGPGYVLVGDAAGMINPSTGEGIAYALETGRAAARHLDAALGAGESDLRGYSREVAKTYGAHYRVGRGLTRLIADPARMERLVDRTMATDRRLRFAATLLLNLDDPSTHTLDQYGARALTWFARATRWEPACPMSTPQPAAGTRPAARALTKATTPRTNMSRR